MKRRGEAEAPPPKRDRKFQQTNVQVLRRFHDQPPGHRAGQVELLMGVVEEADGVAGGEEGGVAETGACVKCVGSESVIVDY